MDLKYGQTETYKHELTKEQMDWIISRTNRSRGQTQFLFQLVDGDFENLKKLEMQISNCFYPCPGDKEEVDKLMKIKPKCNDALIL